MLFGVILVPNEWANSRFCHPPSRRIDTSSYSTHQQQYAHLKIRFKFNRLGLTMVAGIGSKPMRG